MENQIFTNRTKASSRPIGSVGTYLGKVVRIADNGDLFVKIPNLSTNSVFGPCKNFAGHAPVDIYVIVSFLDSRLDEPVVTGVETSVRYKVGDTGPGGGIVFYVDRFGEYSGFTYLEVAPSSTQVERTWSTDDNQTVFVSGADSKALGAGYQNTLDIIAQTGNEPESCAASYCASLVSGGVLDWYLPSLGELKLAYEILNLQLNFGNFSVGNYWSSSEFDEGFAFYQDYISGTQNLAFKFDPYYVRPVRRFE